MCWNALEAAVSDTTGKERDAGSAKCQDERGVSNGGGVAGRGGVVETEAARLLCGAARDRGVEAEFNNGGGEAERPWRRSNGGGGDVEAGVAAVRGIAGWMVT